MNYPAYFKHKHQPDYRKVESPDRGHFLRNMKNRTGNYCYQSNDIGAVEIDLVLAKGEDSLIEGITKEQYLEAVKLQVERNNEILKIVNGI